MLDATLMQALRLPPRTPLYEAEQNPTTSRKPWANVFTLYNWDVQAIMFPTFLTKFESLRGNAEDAARLSGNTHRPNHPTTVITEGDVVSHLDENIIIHLKQAFTDLPYVSFHAQHGPGPAGPPGGLNIFADWAFKYKNAHVTVGECKKPGIIRQTQWDDPGQASTATLALARELVGTAYYYNCPRVWCYDGIHLLLLRWRNPDRDQFTKNGPETWCIPVQSGSNDGCVSVGFALYMFVREGVHAIHGMMQNMRNIQGIPIGNVRLRYDNVGKPVLGGNGTPWSYDHPDEWDREFDETNGLWYWTDPDNPQTKVEEASFM